MNREILLTLINDDKYYLLIAMCQGLCQYITSTFSLNPLSKSMEAYKQCECITLSYTALTWRSNPGLSPEFLYYQSGDHWLLIYIVFC